MVILIAFLYALCNVGDGLLGGIDGKNLMEEPLSCDPYYLKSIFNKQMINDFDLNLKEEYFLVSN